MPDSYGFNRESVQRIVRAVKRVEAMPEGMVWPNQTMLGPLPYDIGQFYELTENLTPGGTADAHPVNWSVSDGAFNVDTGTTVTLDDSTSQNWGVAGEWLRIIPRASEIATGGIVYDVVGPGAPWYEMTLGGQLNQGSSQTASLTIRGSSRSVTVYDRFLKASDNLPNTSRVGVVCDVANARFVVVQAVCS
jgi:hypothetical protein